VGAHLAPLKRVISARYMINKIGVTKEWDIEVFFGGRPGDLCNILSHFKFCRVSATIPCGPIRCVTLSWNAGSYVSHACNFTVRASCRVTSPMRDECAAKADVEWQPRERVVYKMLHL